MTTTSRARTPVLLALVALLAARDASGQSETQGKRGEARKFHLNPALAPMLNQQQIEGPARDDLLVNDYGISSSMSLTYAVLPWLEPGIWTQFDAGAARRATYSRPDSGGVSRKTDEVEGTFVEIWTALVLRARHGPVFAELGWAPLIVRKDTARTDLPNADGDADGLFVGSRTVAWMVNLGGAVPIHEDVELTLRVQYRIRYLVSRGGEPLAHGSELGNMVLQPSVGVGHRF